MRVGSSASRGLFEIVVGHRNQRDDFASAHVDDQAGRGQGLVLGAGGDQFVAQRVLDPQVNGKLDRLLQTVGGEPRQMQIGEPAAVEPFFDAGDPLIVDIDVADHVRDLGAVRVDALVLGQKADAGQAEPVNLLALLGRDLALEPHEAALGAEPVAQLGRVELGHRRGEQLGRLVDVDDAMGLAEQRRRAHIGREDLAVAVEQVGSRGRDRIVPGDAPSGMGVGRGREHDQPRRHDPVSEGEDQDGKPDPGPGLDGTIDVAAIEQRAHQPTAPRLYRLRLYRLRRYGLRLGRSHDITSLGHARAGCRWSCGRSAPGWRAPCRSDRDRPPAPARAAVPAIDRGDRTGVLRPA